MSEMDITDQNTYVNVTDSPDEATLSELKLLLLQLKIIRVIVDLQ